MPVFPISRRSAMLPLRPGVEAGIAGNVAGDEEAAGCDTLEAPLHRLGAFGETERDRGLAVDPGHGRAGHQLRLADVFGPDAHAGDFEAVRQVAAFADGHRDADRSRAGAADPDVVAERAGERAVGLRDVRASSRG